MKILRNIIAVVWILILAVGIAKNDPLHIGHLLSVIIIFPVLYWGHGVWLESYLNHHAVVRSQESLRPGLYTLVSNPNEVFAHTGNGLVMKLIPGVIAKQPFTPGQHNYFIHTHEGPDMKIIHQGDCIEVSSAGVVSVRTLYVK